MRTDSVNIADSALREIAELVQQDYGKAYSLAEPRRYKTSSRSAQEAHEAVRPTSVLRTPQLMSRSRSSATSSGCTRLIWQRTVATQMADARFDQVGIDIEALRRRRQRRATPLRACARPGRRSRSTGSSASTSEGRDDEPDEDAEADAAGAHRRAGPAACSRSCRSSTSRSRRRGYTEASLVKTLEELGIGRPSTYASIISTIQDRGYVRLEDRRFRPEDVGMVVTDKLVEHFPDIVDVNFTGVHGGRARRHRRRRARNGRRCSTSSTVRSSARSRRPRTRSSGTQEELDELCPLCPQEGREPGKLQVKLGRLRQVHRVPELSGMPLHPQHGRQRAPEPELLDETCPECGSHSCSSASGATVRSSDAAATPSAATSRRTRRPSTGVTCPQCHQGELVEKHTRFGTPFYSCDRYPECDAGGEQPAR